MASEELLDMATEAYQRLAKFSVWDELTDCLLWVGGADRKGYGRFMLRGQTIRLHRLVWELKHGPVGPDVHICHKCDTPACINVDHLFAGDAVSNMKDRHAKGRYPVGMANHKAKLTDQQIIAIRESPLPSLRLGPMYGVDSSTIRRARRGANWKHIHGY